MPQVARRLADDLEDGWYVNLGIGRPTVVADLVSPEREVVFHSENGILGLGPRPALGQEDPNLVNAGKEPATIRPGGSYFSQAESFAMIRGGHIDAAILGAYQVSVYGDLASWRLPREPLGRVGGSMDLAVGSRRVFVLMEHCTKTGEHKIVGRCSYPLTASRCVTRIYTNLGVFEPTPNGLALRELAPDVDEDVVRRSTGDPLIT